MIYLQMSHGYVVYPSTCQRDTMVIECMLAARNGERFGVQVKSGQTSLNQDDFKNSDFTIYLFAACGVYRGEPNNRTKRIEPNIVKQFIFDNSAIMPGRIQKWIEFSRRTQEVL